jgi:hypothetical protein
VRATPDRLPSASWVVRGGLVLFVLLWLFGPAALRSVVPIWLPFVIALGLTVLFFVNARRAGEPARPDRGPQVIDRERYGYTAETDELIVVPTPEGERWIPYSGETAEELDALIADPEHEALSAAPYFPERQRLNAIRQFVVGVGVIAALAAAAWYIDSRRGWSGLDDEKQTQAEERFSAEASRVAGHSVTIRCDESGQRVGFVQHSDGVALIGGDLAYLTPERCYDLYRLASEGDVSSSQTARAVAVLAHEAWHLAGVRDEAKTECYALQSGVELGQRLGLDEETARRMMRQQLAENSGRSAATSEYVVGPDCRDGGKLDLHPQRSAFP